MVRWRSERRSSNVEDRRGMRPRMGTPMKMGGGLGAVVILALVLLLGQLAGISDQVRRVQSGARNQAEVNALQVRMELQADCFAGVWAFHANQQRNLLQPGDVDEGLGAAAAIGDDRLLRRAGRRVAPESFTHGSSEDRQRWLMTGLQSGDLNACEIFQR